MHYRVEASTSRGLLDMNASFRKLMRATLIVVPMLAWVWLCAPWRPPEVEGGRIVNGTVRRVARERRGTQVAKIEIRFLIGYHNCYTLSDPKDVESFLLALEKSTRDRRVPSDPLDAQWTVSVANPELHVRWRFFAHDGTRIREFWSEASGLSFDWGPEVSAVLESKWPDFYDWENPRK